MSYLLKIRSLLAGVLLLAVSVGPARAQSFVVVHLQTNAPDALVYADSMYLGQASSTPFLVPREVGSLRLVHPAADSWSMIPTETPLELQGVDTLRVELNAPYHYAIRTTPFDANVFLETPGERVLLGHTPLLHASPDPLAGMLLLQKDGYELKRLTPGGAVWNTHEVELEPSADLIMASAEDQPRWRNSRWLNLALGGAALASGALAVHFKMKADARYDLYAVDGDPRLRGAFERYDHRAFAALGTMQVSMGILAIRLVRQ